MIYNEKEYFEHLQDRTAKMDKVFSFRLWETKENSLGNRSHIPRVTY